MQSNKKNLEVFDPRQESRPTFNNKANYFRKHETSNIKPVHYDDHAYENGYYPRQRNRRKQPRLKDSETSQKDYLYSNFYFLFFPNSNPTNIYEEEKAENDIDWRHVAQVIYRSNEQISCPICLNDALQIVAPQCTPCGHIFCWPCILKHLSFDKSPKCPCCNVPFMKSELRSTTVSETPDYQAGSVMKFKLFLREKSGLQIYNGDDFTENFLFRRKRVANQTLISEILRKETQELEDECALVTSSQELDMLPFVLEVSSHKLKINKFRPKTYWKRRRTNGRDTNGQTSRRISKKLMKERA
eukprot:TRINITY_DN12297_c0_g1_i1.p1 TRINITY_DN12297_c0_g1~~TRINITY_DN12297_c0_g1_i1.p1  ORF type:complete len:301 (-),score=53.45 TRINITY_DN12297_c0_g1_i1:314-1216(-)